MLIRSLKTAWNVAFASVVAAAALHVLASGVLPYVERKVEGQAQRGARSAQALTEQIYRIRAVAERLR